MTLPFIGAKQLHTHKLKLPPSVWLPLLCSIYFAYLSAEARWDWWCRNCIPLKLFYIQEIKVEEEGEVGRSENAFAKPPQGTDFKTSFHCERSPAPCWSTEGGYLLVSFHCSCLLDVSARDFAFSLQEWKKPYSSILKELRLVDATEKTGLALLAQLSPYITYLPMEAKGAKTLFFDESDCVREPHWKQAAH